MVKKYIKNISLLLLMIIPSLSVYASQIKTSALHDAHQQHITYINPEDVAAVHLLRQNDAIFKQIHASETTIPAQRTITPWYYFCKVKNATPTNTPPKKRQKTQATHKLCPGCQKTYRSSSIYSHLSRNPSCSKVYPWLYRKNSGK